MAIIKKFRIKSFKQQKPIVELKKISLSYGKREILDDISFTATDKSGEKITINSEYVKKNLGELVKDTDLSKFIL